MTVQTSLRWIDPEMTLLGDNENQKVEPVWGKQALGVCFERVYLVPFVSLHFSLWFLMTLPLPPRKVDVYMCVWCVCTYMCVWAYKPAQTQGPKEDAECPLSPLPYSFMIGSLTEPEPHCFLAMLMATNHQRSSSV